MARSVARQTSRRTAANLTSTHRRQGRVPQDAAYAHLFRVRPRDIWHFLRAQPISYWLVSVYLFLEYVRPQAIYPILSTGPWSQLVLLLCAGAVVLEGRAVRTWHPVDALVGWYSIVVLASWLVAYSPEAAAEKLEVYFSWVLIYLLISKIVNTEGRFLVFMLGFLLYSFKMSQFSVRSWAQIGFAFRDWGTTGAPGWFQNSGEFGIQMAVFLPLALHFILALRPYWSKLKFWLFMLFPTTAVLGMIASSSRGALVGGAAVGMWLVLKSRYRMRAAVALALVIPIVIALIPAEQEVRIEAAGEDNTSLSRITYWRHGLQIAAQFPILGIGYANWGDYYWDHYFLHALPHNIFIEALAELGYTGLVAFVMLIAATLATNLQTRKIAAGLTNGRFLHHMAHGLDGALIGFLASGFFVTVLYYPYFWINLAMTVALHYAARDSQASSRRGTSRPGPVGNRSVGRLRPLTPDPAEGTT